MRPNRLVVLPKITDPRLHLAAVIITIHVLGQTVLGFRVSIPQILVAIVISAVIELIWTFRQTRMIVWPASAMLTGSGVALILRLVDAERGNHWSWEGWHIFALVAAFSLLTKYTVRHKGTHLFNPSNVGLVAAFLILGSGVIEPLDFWWGPFSPGLAAAYLVILFGGILITARLRLLAMAAAFWAALAVGLGALSIPGHCITAAWALQPVCGLDFWWVVVSSPELAIFLFFMITDPKTIPSGGGARVKFAIALAILCTLLIAPQTTEFGAKVALLGGLTVLTPVRRLFERERVWEWAPPAGTYIRSFARGAALGSSLVLVLVVIVVAGLPARQTAPTAAEAATTLIEAEVDPSSLPQVTVAQDVRALNDAAASQSQQLAVALAEALAIEAEAVRLADTSLLRGAAHGERLVDMERRIQGGAAAGRLVVPHHEFESLNLVVIHLDGPQGGASLAFEAVGIVERVTYDSEGVELERSETPFRSTYVLQRSSDERWMIAQELPGLRGAHTDT